MINISVEHPLLAQLRERTATLLGEEITDDNGLMADLYEIGYLKQPVSGYLGAMAVQYEGRVEFFADMMPGERGLTSNGGSDFHYASIHSEMIRSVDALNRLFSRGESLGYCTGLIVVLEDGSYYSGKSILSLSQHWGCQVGDIDAAIDIAVDEAGLSGEIMPEELVSDKYNQTRALASPTKVLRVAAKWKEKTLAPPYNPDTGEKMDEVLSRDHALAGLAMEMRDVVIGRPQRDIDIIRRVAKT